MKKIKTWLILFLAFISMGISIPSVSNVSAAVVNPTDAKQRSQANTFRSILGKSLYNQYIGIDQKLNGNYTFHHLLLAANKIDYNYYNKYAKIRKFFGNVHYLYINNSLTTPNDVNTTPWETNNEGQNLTRNLYNGRDVYYHMNATGETADIYNAAILAWNQLGVIQLIPTDNTTDPNVIQLNSAVDNLANGQADGLTNYTPYTNGLLANTSVQINTNVLNEDNYRQLAVVEHEIGHALGFGHDNRFWGKRTSLMNGIADDQVSGQDFEKDSAKQNLLGAKEQGKLEQMYHLSVMDGYYQYPIMNNIN